ncbi:MAG TPA: gliding motility-associated C-terminal domain-containing protein [Chitinophagaceae bacterium]|nr:gliding motility-associated C-terminal domain-containing protein [Chitinophagaceae bacterium]
MNFNGGGPSLYYDSCYSIEGTAALCDSMGQLLFYCDGTNAFDKTHAVMPNGAGIEGHSSTTQGVAIASVLGSDSLFYLFSLKTFLHAGKLSYSIVDLSLNSGLGDIVSGSKNMFIDSNLSEKMIVAGTCDKQWLVLHHIDSGIFYAYDLSIFPAPPVKSYTGLHRLDQAYALGEMKVSGDFTSIALTNGYHAPETSELYDFDVSTGIVSNYRLIDSFSRGFFCYGAEFSPDGSKLYVSGLFTGIFQYDLSLPSLPAIRASKYLVDTGSFYALRLGPDHMIYASTMKDKTFSRIKEPNLGGASCNFEAKFLSAPASAASGILIGLGNQYVYRGRLSGMDTSGPFSRTIVFCAGEAATVSRPGYQAYLWSDSDTNSSRVFTAPGTFWLKARSNCGWRIDTFHLVSVPYDTSFMLKMDTVLCAGTAITLSAPADRDWYHWADGDSVRVKTVVAPDTIAVLSKTGCSFTSDTFIVKNFLTDTSYSLAKDTSVCIGTSLVLHAPKPLKEAYRWSDGSKDSVKKFVAPETAVLVSNIGCHRYYDTFIVRAIPLGHILSVTDSFICPGDSFSILGKPGADVYKWYDGDTVSSARTIHSGSGRYWVSSRKGCTIWVDTVTVTEQARLTFTSAQSVPICEGTAATLASPLESGKYTWNTGADSREIDVTLPGKYWVSSLKDCILYADTFYTALRPFTTTNEQSDTCIFFRDSITISAPDSFTHYFWLDGGNKKDTVLFHSGTAYVTAINNQNCSILKKRIRVELIHYSKALRDTFLCNSDTIVLDATVDHPNAQYLWHTGDTSSQLKIATAGPQVVRITTKGCSVNDTIQVDRIDLEVSAGGDQAICEGEKVILKASPDNALYKWSTGEVTQSIEVNTSNRYEVTVTKGECSVSNAANIQFVQCYDCIAVPNAFTPNKDGINDYFKPLINCPVKKYELKIMNRWGQEIYSSVSPNQSWDGTFKGIPMEGNTCFYLLKVLFEISGGKEELFSGDITLIR